MKRLLFIYNPYAGKGSFKSRVSDVVDILVKAEYEVVIYPTQANRDAYYKVRDIAPGEYERVVCAGGDGTLDEVVSGMMSRHDKVPIGYIPTGTTNDFAGSFKIPKHVLKAADNSVRGYRFPFDIGQFNDNYFVYVAAFGIFTDVSYQTKQELKNVLGHMAYVLEGTKRIFNVESYRLSVKTEDCEIEDEFIFGMITNSKTIGGFRNMVDETVFFDDGEFEVTLIKTPRNPVELQETMTSLLMAQPDEKRIYSLRSGRIFIESQEEIPWALDGEYGGDHRKVDIINHRQALEVMVQEKHLKVLSKR